MGGLGAALGVRLGAAWDTLGLRQSCHPWMPSALGVAKAILVLFVIWTGGGAAYAETVRDLRLNANGETRRYLVVTPDGVSGPAPVVIALHGAAQSPESFRAYFGLDAAAAKHGFVAVYPQGEGRVWNDGRPAAMRLKLVLRPGDDVAFLVALARRLVADGIADPARIYLTGISNGGFMVQRMACEHADLFAAYSAIMSTAPANYREECQPARAVPILFIHGTADSVIGYGGFWTPVGATLSAPDSARLFAGIDGCEAANARDLPDLAPGDGTRAVLRRWDGCRDGAAVELITIERGGHQSPAMVETKPDLATPFLGLRSQDIDSGEEIWRFMSAYGAPLPPTVMPLPPATPARPAKPAAPRRSDPAAGRADPAKGSAAPAPAAARPAAAAGPVPNPAPKPAGAAAGAAAGANAAGPAPADQRGISAQ
ncbi:PHB depolymerase family esterase [Xanthobacter sp. KR7-65]|uniref:alpha/beta hydrolase family esterase n=1 Tax=Xanthobacter sp. KR7-65 TaxID=3156612 RepID=UPI0032B43467